MDNSNYFIGLDMGTESVGWAVTDTNYRLLRAKGKDMWGARLFSRADTAQERRMFRIGRRRRQREIARINYLKMVFADEINKIDPGFMTRLDESKYFVEDRSDGNRQSFSVFNDKGFTDIDYFSKYKTIFHLRNDLLKDDPVIRHDVRLVYLALLNMFKHRGNFLIDSVSEDGSENRIDNAYLNLADTAEMFDIYFPRTVAFDEMLNTLGNDRISKNEKREQLISQLGIIKKDALASYELVSLVCGLKGKLYNIFGGRLGEENKSFSLSFSDGDFDEKIIQLQEIIGDEYVELIKSTKEVYDIGMLTGILKGYSYLSQARVKEYEEHQNDLKTLKDVLKQYDKNAYNKLFRVMEEGNYSAYVGSVNSDKQKIRRNGNKGREQDVLYKTILSMLKKLPKEADNDERVEAIRQKIDRGTFLPKQLTGKNGVIPNQVHAREMKKILDNASTYLSFLNDIDESGLTQKQRILEMFKFYIPYYIGPLGQEHLDESGYNVWARRIEPGKIYPWNIEKKIDVSEAAEKFIVRMLRNCTYLNDEESLPKQSLLYEKFMVLNELNCLRIRGERISVELKQNIYNDLFLKGKKVTATKLRKYLVAKGVISGEDDFEGIILGIDGDFKNAMSSLNKFAPIFGLENVYGRDREMIEQIIFWGTVFGNDKKIFAGKISEKFGDVIDENNIRRITGFSYSGWGNLSKELLEMPGAKGSDEEEKSIIISMWESNENLMELLGADHTYRSEIEKKTLKTQIDLMEFSADDLNDMYLSPSVKRMVWQTIRILKDIYAVKGCSPKRIFVEMPREDGEKGKRTQSRKKRLEELYKGQKEFLNDIGGYDERDFRQKKLYLYYLQNGKSLYSGKPIDLENLLSNNSKYDIDHIYPRHYIKDDSIENNLVLVEKEINNDIKGGDYPIDPEIQLKMGAFWKDLLRRGFLTKEKYARLTRKTEFTEAEQADFIARQLVETRQGTKAITQILQEAFPESEVVFSKAGAVSDFRKKRDIPKVRCINSCHHAHDAYLNIVVGNTYYTKFTSNPLNFVRQARKNRSDDNYKYHMDKVFDYKVERNGEVAWVPQSDDNPGTIQTVKRMLGRNTVLLTYKPYSAHGGISRKSTIYNAATAANNTDAYFPVKTSYDRLRIVSKYGGKTISNTAYALVQYTIKGKTKKKDEIVRALIGVPKYIGKVEKENEKLINYLYDEVAAANSKKRIEDFSIRKYPIRFGSMVNVDDYIYTIGGASGEKIYLKDFVPLYLSSGEQAYIKKVEKAVNTSYYLEKDQKGEIITSERNDKIYKVLLDKLRTGVFSNKRCTIAEILLNGEDEFSKLSIDRQCYVIMQILFWFNTSTQTTDLSDLKNAGGSAHSGMLTMSNKISKCKRFELIDSSPTGLFQRRIDLLQI